MSNNSDMSSRASTTDHYVPVAEPLSKFTCFRNLPAEIRCKIWSCALHAENSNLLHIILIEISLNNLNNPKDNGHIIKRTNDGSREYPLTSRLHLSLYNACAESRHEFEKLFPETLGLTSEHKDEGPELRYDESKNLFLLRNASRLTSIARSSMQLVIGLTHDALAMAGLTKVRHLAFSLDNKPQGFAMVTKLTNASVKFNLMFPSLRKVSLPIPIVLRLN